MSVVAAAAVSAALWLSAATAWAHVSIQPPTAAQGGFSTLSFVVPNENDAADTVRFEVQLPPGHPIASVAVQAKPGWRHAVTRTKLAQPIQTGDGEFTEAVTTVTWSGGVIEPGEFDEFTLSAGPLPTDVATVSFKALQTYSDGQVVRWIDEATAGGPEPEHPAPTLTLTKSDTGADGSASNGDDDSTARALGIVAVVAGILGLVCGAAALVRSRPRTSAR
jgi:uncharacterized protein YcnI